MKAYVTPDFKKLFVSHVTKSVAVESMNIGFLFSKTVLVFARFVFVVVILEFAFVNLLLSSESLLLLVDKVTYIKAHSKNTRPMPSVNK